LLNSCFLRHGGATKSPGCGAQASDLWVIPGDRTKNGVEHDVPPSRPAAALIAVVPTFGPHDFIFTVNGQARISGYSGAKRKLDARMLELAREADPQAPDIARWTFHDLRRTAASGMARLGFLVHVIEAVLNSHGGEISGVTAIYNRHKHLEEKRLALEGWAAHVNRITASGDPLPSRA
jgi:integrase